MSYANGSSFQKNEIQNYWKKLPAPLQASGKFVIDSALLLDWGDLSQDEVYDLGCGFDSWLLFDTLFPKIRKVIGIDNSSSIIHYCKKFHSRKKMDYYEADITDEQSLKGFKNKISKLVSIYCLNCVSDKRTAIKNLKSILRPGGEAIIVTGVMNPHYKCALQLLESPKWEFFKGLLKKFPEHCIVQTDEMDFIMSLFTEFGFEIVFSEKVYKSSDFETEEKFKDSKMTKDRVIGKHLPDYERIIFTEEYMEKLIELSTDKQTGKLRFTTATGKFVIRKSFN